MRTVYIGKDSDWQGQTVTYWFDVATEKSKGVYGVQIDESGVSVINNKNEQVVLGMDEEIDELPDYITEEMLDGTYECRAPKDVGREKERKGFGCI